MLPPQNASLRLRIFTGPTLPRTKEANFVQVKESVARAWNHSDIRDAKRSRQLAGPLPEAACEAVKTARATERATTLAAALPSSDRLKNASASGFFPVATANT